MEGTVPSPRTPGEDDLAKLCASLNAHGLGILSLGGLAMNQQGFLRATEDIDLLLEKSRGNQKKVLKALEVLPDKAVREVNANDLDDLSWFALPMRSWSISCFQHAE